MLSVFGSAIKFFLLPHLSVSGAHRLFQLNMVITSILILCAIAMALYQLIQWLEHYYKKR